MTRSLTSMPQLAVFLALASVLTSVAHADDTGQKVYERWCAPCHAPGPGHPGTQSLQLKYGGKTPADLLERKDLSAQMVSTFVRQGVLMMAPFRKTEITDAELTALSAYVASNFKAP